MDSLIVRQPILDKDLGVFGYKVMYRPSAPEPLDREGDGGDTLSAIRGAYLLLGPGAFGEKRRIFLDFTRSLILGGVGHALPGRAVVIDVTPDVAVDDALVRACRRLREDGLLLSVDASAIVSGDHRALLPLADIVRVPFDLSGNKGYPETVQACASSGKMLLAENVDTREDQRAACDRGFQLFSGSWFSKPVALRTKEITGHGRNYLELLREVNRVELDFSELERIIKQDTSLCYTLLYYVNSAYFGVDPSISSIHRALVLLGEKEIRKWANLVLFTFMASDQPSELLVTCLIRAKVCEAMGHLVGMGERSSELFLMGMFSMIDVLMGRPMSDILRALRLSEEVETALLKGSGAYGEVFAAVLSYESGNWEEFSAYAANMGVNESAVPDLYLEAVRWAETVSGLRRAAACHGA